MNQCLGYSVLTRIASFLSAPTTKGNHDVHGPLALSACRFTLAPPGEPQGTGVAAQQQQLTSSTVIVLDRQTQERSYADLNRDRWIQSPEC